MLALNTLLHPSPDVTSRKEGHVVYFVIDCARTLKKMRCRAGENDADPLCQPPESLQQPVNLNLSVRAVNSKGRTAMRRWVWLTALVLFLIGLLSVAALFSDVLRWVPAVSAVPLGICAGGEFVRYAKTKDKRSLVFAFCFLGSFLLALVTAGIMHFHFGWLVSKN